MSKKSKVKRIALKPKIVKARKQKEHRALVDVAAGPMEGTENDFAGVDLVDWDERVFANASHFRLTRYQHGDKRQRFDTEVPAWPHALVLAITAQRAGHTVIVYAVAASGRSCV